MHELVLLALPLLFFVGCDAYAFVGTPHYIKQGHCEVSARRFYVALLSVLCAPQSHRVCTYSYSGLLTHGVDEEAQNVTVSASFAVSCESSMFAISFLLFKKLHMYYLFLMCRGTCIVITLIVLSVVFRRGICLQESYKVLSFCHRRTLETQRKHHVSQKLISHQVIFTTTLIYCTPLMSPSPNNSLVSWTKSSLLGGSVLFRLKTEQFP